MASIQQQDEFVRDLGFPAWRVGGSVRDEELGRDPKDGDYVVVATLTELRHVLREAGKKPTDLRLRNGTVVGCRFMHGGDLIEVCLPRREVSTGPGHGDFRIEAGRFVLLEEDAERRDFTMNALYRDVRTGRVWDPTGRGLSDLRSGIIRTLSPASFAEDPLRSLRAFRFMSQLGFVLSDEARTEMRKWASHVTGLTRRGVSGTAWDEFIKLLMGDEPLRALREMRDSGVMAALLPELEPMLGFHQENEHHDLTVDEHSFLAVQIAADLKLPLAVRLALLFHDAGKPLVAWRGEDGNLHYYDDGEHEAHEVASARLLEQALYRLNAGRRTREQAVALVLRHMMGFSTKRVKPTRVRMLRAELGHEACRNLLHHVYCDASAKGRPNDEVINRIRDMIDILREADERGVPDNVKALAVSGEDIIAAAEAEMSNPRSRSNAYGGPGPWVGQVQRQLLHEVACDPRRNDRKWLLGRAARLARKNA